MKSEIPNEVVDFQPDAIQIRDEKLPRWARLGIFFSFFFFAAVLIWSCLAEVDIIVQAPGKIVSKKQIVAIKPIDTSIIQNVHVDIGDIVKKGDILISFDQTINKKEIERLEREIIVLTARIDRFYCEAKGREFVPKAEYGESGAEEKAIFDQRSRYYAERMKYYDSALNQLDASKKTKEDNMKKQKERLARVWDMEKMYANLQEKKTVSLRDLWNIQISRMEMEANVDSIQNSLIELEHQRGSILAQKQAFEQEWADNISEELVKLKREYDSTLKMLDKNRRPAPPSELRAPCDAMVYEVMPLPAGSAVREGETVMTLLPLDSGFEIEVTLQSSRDIPVFRLSSATIMFDLYPVREFGVARGTVVSAYLDKKVRIRLDSVPEGIRLLPGMTAKVVIECLPQRPAPSRRKPDNKR